MYNSILHATDLRKEHYHLAEQAAKLAKKCNAKLYLLHVIELPASLQLAQGLGFTELANPAKDDAKTVLSLLGEELGVPKEHQFVEIGTPKEHIFNKIAELGCQLVIIGRHTPDGLPSLLGGTAHATVSHAPCDVLTLQV